MTGTKREKSPDDNNNKRRCIDDNQFTDSLPHLDEEIASMIRDEISANSYSQNDVFTFRQVQMICGRIVKNREQRLREEYNRILAIKLSEQCSCRLVVPPGNSPIIVYDPRQRSSSALSLPLPDISSVSAGPVLLISNLSEHLAKPDALFTLFGAYGDVIRVKILFNKKDSALVQMTDANQAQLAKSYLDRQKVFGKIIRITQSRHHIVQMPREANEAEAGLTKDFTNSPMHRFKVPGSKNHMNIYPPSNFLHIANIPASVDQNYIQKTVKETCGFEFSSFRFFQNDRKMGVMRFESVEHATIALIKMHNFKMSDDSNLRVSFTKSA